MVNPHPIFSLTHFFPARPALIPLPLCLSKWSASQCKTMSSLHQFSSRCTSLECCQHLLILVSQPCPWKGAESKLLAASGGVQSASSVKAGRGCQEGVLEARRDISGWERVELRVEQAERSKIGGGVLCPVLAPFPSLLVLHGAFWIGTRGSEKSRWVG